MTFCWGFQNVKVTGKIATPAEAPVLVVAPHSTLFDPMVLFYCFSVPSAISRAENNKMPIISGTDLSKTCTSTFTYVSCFLVVCHYSNDVGVLYKHICLMVNFNVNT